jgi:hypothetical protein
LTGTLPKPWAHAKEAVLYCAGPDLTIDYQTQHRWVAFLEVAVLVHQPLLEKVILQQGLISTPKHLFRRHRLLRAGKMISAFMKGLGARSRFLCRQMKPPAVQARWLSEEALYSGPSKTGFCGPAEVALVSGKILIIRGDGCGSTQ